MELNKRYAVREMIISLEAGGLESLLDDVSEGNLVSIKETNDGVLLGLAEALLLGGIELLPLIDRGTLVALSKSVVGLDVSLKSCLHFRLLLIINLIFITLTMASFKDKFLKDLEDLSADEAEEEKDSQADQEGSASEGNDEEDADFVEYKEREDRYEKLIAKGYQSKVRGNPQFRDHIQDLDRELAGESTLTER